MYARPTADQEVLRFGVSGKLWRQVMVLFDRQSGSLWSQRDHRAIAGPLAGWTLEVLESTVTDWSSWNKTHPATTVVVQPKPGADSDYPPHWKWLAALGLALVSAIQIALKQRKKESREQQSRDRASRDRP